MISLLCYWWILLWNIENVDKVLFAIFSTFEIAAELMFLIPFICVYLPDWIREHRRDK